MVIDTFPICSELDLLEIRLKTLSPLVDKFVLVEAELAQSLLLKPLHFEENKERFKPWLNKIEHVIIRKEECPDNNIHPWEMEHFTRNSISRGLARLDLGDDDLVLLSDLDEIPHPDKLERAIYRVNQEGKAVKGVDGNFVIALDMALAFEGSFHAYFLNFHCPGKTWVGTVAVPYWQMKRMTPQGIRDNKDYFETIDDALWHFSYVTGGWQGVWSKFQHTIEPLNKACLIKKQEEFLELYRQKVLVEKTFIYMDRLWDGSVKLMEYPFGELPECVREDRSKWGHMLWKEGMVL